MSIFGSGYKKDTMKEWEPTIKYFKDGGTIGELPEECIDGIVAGQLSYLKSPEYKKKKEIEIQDQIEQYIESRIKESKDRTQELEALVLDWRHKSSLYLMGVLNKHIEDFDTLPEYLNEYEESYDEHFNITKLRNGNTDN